jgi:hypothetical protein
MRSYVISLPLLAVVLLPSTGSAQVYQLPTPPPVVTAADAIWRTTGQPFYYAGGIYYPSGPTEFFDGQVMARIGVVDGVPVYENKTLEPWSVVLVPTGQNMMQPYERRRSGTLAGTVGSRMPGQPIQRDVELSVANDSTRDGEIDGIPVITTGRAQWTWPTPPPPVVSAPALAPLSARAKTVSSSVPVIRTIPRRETTNAGPYVDFAGTHHYSSGKAVVHDPQRFTRIGDSAGAAVFREAGGPEKTIYVEAVRDGLLAPYTRP